MRSNKQRSKKKLFRITLAMAAMVIPISWVIADTLKAQNSYCDKYGGYFFNGLCYFGSEDGDAPLPLEGKSLKAFGIAIATSDQFEAFEDADSFVDEELGSASAVFINKNESVLFLNIVKSPRENGDPIVDLTKAHQALDGGIAGITKSFKKSFGDGNDLVWEIAYDDRGSAMSYVSPRRAPELFYYNVYRVFTPKTSLTRSYCVMSLFENTKLPSASMCLASLGDGFKEGEVDLSEFRAWLGVLSEKRN